MYIPEELKSTIERDMPRVYDDPDFISELDRRLNIALEDYYGKKRGKIYGNK